MNYMLLIVALVLPAITASPLSLDKDATPVNIRLINEIHSPRLKRSVLVDNDVPNLPDHLVFGVPVGTNDDAVLRLKRTTLLPTITSDGRVDSISENAAVYTDPSRHSSMIVRREARDYSLQGTFHHSGKEWNLQPLSRNTRSSQSHQLSPMMRAKEGHDVISFAGDEYTVDGKPIPEKHLIKNTTRHKRDATQHVVEIAFIVDFEDYNKWVALVGASNAIIEMQLWYTYLAESINIRYNTIQDSDIAIATTTTILKLITRDADDDFIENIVTSGIFDGLTGLQELRTWVGQQGDIPVSDHYMLFTGFEINGASGIAYGSALCSSSSVSISENTFQASLGGIAAHELGHSLSAIHDSSDGCNDNDQFIMSTILSTPVDPVNEGNPWKFSPCSIAKFKSFLWGETCTLPAATTGVDVLPAPESGERAGQVLSLDNQCRRLFQDASSFFCTTLQIQEGGLETLCGGMYCAIPGRNGVCQTSLPQEFSSCGSDKWCVLGQCVNIPTTQEPTTTTTTTTTTQPTTTTEAVTTTTTTTTTTPTTEAPTTRAPSTTTTTPTTTTTTTTPTTTSTPRPTTTVAATTSTTPATVTTTPRRETTTRGTPSTASTTRSTPTTVPTTVVVETSQATSPRPSSTSTTPRPSGPTDITDCYRYLFRDWDKWWQCVREVYLNQRRIEMEERKRQREEQRKRQEEQRKRQQEEQKRRQQERKRNNKNRRF